MSQIHLTIDIHTKICIQIKWDHTLVTQHHVCYSLHLLKCVVCRLSPFNWIVVCCVSVCRSVGRSVCRSVDWQLDRAWQVPRMESTQSSVGLSVFCRSTVDWQLSEYMSACRATVGNCRHSLSVCRNRAQREKGGRGGRSVPDISPVSSLHSSQYKCRIRLNVLSINPFLCHLMQLITGRSCY